MQFLGTLFSNLFLILNFFEKTHPNDQIRAGQEIFCGFVLIPVVTQF